MNTVKLQRKKINQTNKQKTKPHTISFTTATLIFVSANLAGAQWFKGIGTDKIPAYSFNA